MRTSSDKKTTRRYPSTYSVALSVCAVLVFGVVTFTFNGPLVALLAAATSSLSHAESVVFLTPYDDHVLSPGDTIDIDVNIDAKVPINAVGATIKFPTDLLEVVGISKQKSFLDLWTEETTIKEDSGEVHFSGGTTIHGGMTGIGTALTLSVRAKKSGSAKIYFADSQVLSSDGKGTELDTDKRSYTFHIRKSDNGGSSSPATAPVASVARSPHTPNPDLNGDGKITIVDISILAVKMLSTYDPRYDLDMNGSVNLSDLSILFSKMGNK